MSAIPTSRNFLIRVNSANFTFGTDDAEDEKILFQIRDPDSGWSSDYRFDNNDFVWSWDIRLFIPMVFHDVWHAFPITLPRRVDQFARSRWPYNGAVDCTRGRGDHRTVLTFTFYNAEGSPLTVTIALSVSSNIGNFFTTGNFTLLRTTPA